MEINKELEIYSIILGLQCFMEDNKTATEFINNPEVKKLMAELREHFTNKEYYVRFVKLLIDNYVNNPGLQKILHNVLENSTELRIYNYRQYLIYKGHCEYDYKQEKKILEDNSNLSVNLFEDLFQNGIEFVQKKYPNTLKGIADINKIDIKRLLGLFENLIIAKEKGYKLDYTNIIVTIKSYIKKYHANVKEIFASNYSQTRIDEIRKYFVKKESKEMDEELKKSITKDYVMRNDSELTNIIEANFGKYIDDELLYIFVNNLWNRENYLLNYDLLGLVEPIALQEIEEYDEYLRLKQNYKKILNEKFSIDQIDLIKKFIDGDKKVNEFLTKEQRMFLNDMKPLVTKSKSVIYIDENNEISFKTSIQEPTIYERHLVREYYIKLDKYAHINASFQKFKNSKTGLSASSQRITNLFNDSNFEVDEKYEYLNIDFVARLIDKINNSEIITCCTNNYKDFLTDIIPCLFVSGDDKDLEFISNFFNYITLIPKNVEFKIHELSTAYKMISLYKYVDSETLDILGDEVCRKLVFNNQFIDSKYNDEDIKKRLEKAVFAMSKAHDITHSSIPYFKDIKYKNITVRRYNNVDPRVLTSGIDTNTCFKLDGNDNDFILYSILSNNGLLIEILNNNNLCARITASLYYNVLIFNGIRNVKNEYVSASLEDKELNKNIIEAVEILAHKLIDLTKDSECPIDHVCSNMAGILESNEFWQDKPIIDIISTPIDTLNEDYKHFKDLFKNHPDYLTQIDINSTSSNYSSSPFTTDFGSYSLVLIASREGKELYRRFDIAINPQKPIYERPCFVEISGTGFLSPEEVRMCRKILALNLYKTKHLDTDNTKIYIDISKKFKSYYITDTAVAFETYNSNPKVYRI